MSSRGNLSARGTSGGRGGAAAASRGGYRGGPPAPGGEGHGAGGGDSVKPSDEPNFFVYEAGDRIADGKYKLGQIAGRGTFSHVIDGELVTDPRVRVAVKVMRPVSTYIQYVCSAKKEAHILSLLKEAFRRERQSPKWDYSARSLHLEEVANTRRGGDEYTCLVMEKCDVTLYDLVRANGFLGLHIGTVQSIARQCLQQLRRLHSLGYTHTDVKHKNIMLVRENTLAIHKREQWPVQVQTSDRCRNMNVYRHPVECVVRIIDYGNCTHETEPHNTTIHTKQFRAPEVLLQCFPWKVSSDLWCLGCTLYFAYNGDLLFNSHDRGQLVAMVSTTLGGIPPHMLNGFNVPAVTGPMPQDLHSRIHSSHRIFADFLSTLLCVDPEKRVTAEDALKHPFLTVQF
eukprot:PhM_4_TR12306/c0_g1_i1/m.76767/K08287/E2.7.12.1; dual-specificity kinase